jgi:hypothetical protein
MKTLNIKISTLVGIFLGSVSFTNVASAQIVSAPRSVHRDFLDLKAAKRDIANLRADRRRAKRFGNASKAAQDTRLIEADQFWIKRYQHRIKKGG